MSAHEGCGRGRGCYTRAMNPASKARAKKQDRCPCCGREVPVGALWRCEGPHAVMRTGSRYFLLDEFKTGWPLATKRAGPDRTR